jgi:hypothetical protein
MCKTCPCFAKIITGNGWHGHSHGTVEALHVPLELKDSMKTSSMYCYYPVGWITICNGLCRCMCLAHGVILTGFAVIPCHCAKHTLQLFDFAVT